MLKRIKCLAARLLHSLGLIKVCKAPALPKEVLDADAKNSPKKAKKSTKKKTS